MADPKTTTVEVQLSADDEGNEIIRVKEEFEGVPNTEDLGKSVKRLKALAKRATRTSAEGF